MRRTTTVILLVGGGFLLGLLFQPGNPRRVADALLGRGSVNRGAPAAHRQPQPSATPVADGAGAGHPQHDPAGGAPSGHTLAPAVGAMSGMGAGGCGLPQPAFCDTFDAPFPITRSGQLDNSRWSVARVSSAHNPSQGNVDTFYPTDAMFCKDPITGVRPPNDYFECGPQFGESNHFMEAINDKGQYVWDAARIRQPFDFAGRTGTVTFIVDAFTEGNHSFWPEVWISDQPVPAVHSAHPASAAFGNNSVGIAFNADCSANVNCGADCLHRPGDGAVGQITVVQNGVATDYTSASGLTQFGCYSTMMDMHNRFEVRLDQRHVEVWATDMDGSNLREVAALANLSLNFTRGYVYLEHAAYNAEKFGAPADAMHTFHWDDVGFDGPALPLERGYDVADALTPTRDGGVNLGYDLSNGPVSFNLAGVNPSGGAAASVNFTAYYTSVAPLSYRLNNGPAHRLAWPFPDQTTYLWHTVSAPVALSELAPGTNTLWFGQANGVALANIDLTVRPGAEPATPTPGSGVGPGPLPMKTAAWALGHSTEITAGGMNGGGRAGWPPRPAPVTLWEPAGRSGVDLRSVRLRRRPTRGRSRRRRNA